MPSTELRDVVTEAFRRIHDGRSTDDVVIDDVLNQRFLDCCQQKLPATKPFDLNWALFNLRKAAAIGSVTTRSTLLRHDDYLHAAEIAARVMKDKYVLTVDRVLCSPTRRREFDKVAQTVVDDIPTYRIRKAALRLRKGHKLRPKKKTNELPAGESPYPSVLVRKSLQTPISFQENPAFIFFGTPMDTCT